MHVLENNSFLSFHIALALLERGLRHICFARYFRNVLLKLLREHFGSNHLCAFLIVAVLKAVENLLRYISVEAHFDVFLNEFQLLYS